ncbi:acyltransferase [Cryobacterium sp. Y11]|uniref:acyltransferase family protein n=1 Tax=Cryobacterium sp. Y11 TaxID=2045016 RepID=UPI000CE3A0C6|nr:acyltransferase [Cryobacterium sp. Y11]
MRARLDGLTGLRFFAAAWVVLFHFREVSPTTVFAYPVIDPLIRHGAHGVDLFFVLSGFILSHVYLKTFSGKISWAETWSFMAFRFARLYPVHLVTFLMMASLYVAEQVVTGQSSAQSERFSWQSVLSTLTLTHAWFPGVQTPNLPAWSISAEWFAYLLFPLLCVLIRRMWGPVLAFAVAGMGLALLQSFSTSDLGRVMAGFLIGMAAYQVAHRHSASLARLRYLGCATALLIIIWAVTSEAPRMELGLVLFAVLIIALANEGDWLARLLSLRTLVYFGEVSYALYMFHWVARVIVRVGLERANLFDIIPSGLSVTLYLILTLGGAVLLYHFVEKPGRNRLRGLATFSPKRKVREGALTP